MKKHLRLIVVFAALIALIGCSKQEVADNDKDIWNGYENYKNSMSTTLYAGQHIVVGTVEYEFTTDAYFKATYMLIDGWTMSESHLYAGSYDDMPVTNPGSPKIGKFPYKETHNDVSVYEYLIPLTDLPDGLIGFTCAAHCVVNNSNGGEETGWAFGNKTFSDKGWGWYTDNFYQEATDIVVLYAVVEDAEGNLILLHINANSHLGDIIFAETVAATGQVDAIAYDPLTGDLFFVIGDTLYVINMNSDDPAQVIGIIPGLASGGVFINGNYYYLDVDLTSENYLEIIEIQLTYDPDSGWSMIENVDYSSPMPYVGINISDIASNGNYIYLVGRNDNGTPNDYMDDVISLINFNIADGTWNGTVPTELIGYGGDPQIAFGADGNLYAIDINLNGETVLKLLDPNSGEQLETPNDNTGVGEGETIIDIGSGPLK